jgi:hypothetical protein
MFRDAFYQSKNAGVNEIGIHTPTRPPPSSVYTSLLYAPVRIHWQDCHDHPGRRSRTAHMDPAGSKPKGCLAVNSAQSVVQGTRVAGYRRW